MSTDTLREAAQAALTALATCNSNDGDDPWFDRDKVYAARKALSNALAAAPAHDSTPVAFGVFARAGDQWSLQWPPRMTNQAALHDCKAYEPTTVLEVRPLYAGVALTAQQLEKA